MKNMIAVWFAVVGVVVSAALFAGAASTVSSHSTPQLVSEINTALANPIHTSLVVSNSTEGAAATLTMKADQADDASDVVTFSVADGGTLSIKGTSGTNEVLSLTQAGALAIDADLTVTGGDVTGANGNAIDIGEAADGTITLSRDDAGTVTLSSADNNADAALTISAGGTGALTVGDSGSTTAITSSDWAIGATGDATGFGSITADGNVVAPEGNFDGKYAVVGTDATTGLMIATGSTTNAGTVTWGAVFGSQTPFVVATVQGAATNATGGYAACRITSRNATNAVIACDGFIAGAAATVHVIAVGARP